MSTNPDRVENWLQDIRLLDEARYVLLQRVQKLILAVDPKISQDIKYGGILFSAGLPHFSPFCGLFSYTHHASLEFSRGANLADPHQVLEGEGAKRRHIKLLGPQDVFKKNLKAYVTAGFLAAVTGPGPTPKVR